VIKIAYDGKLIWENSVRYNMKTKITISEKCPKTKDRIHVWIVESRFLDRCKACGQKKRVYFEY
jgi:hypothetical protein